VTRLRQPPRSVTGDAEPKLDKLLSGSDRMQINMSEIKLLRELGSGAFGVVRLGEIGGQQVAVKIMKDANSDQKGQFIEEAQVMAKLHHPNLVKLLGIVCEPICIVTEFMSEGSLLDYVRRRRNLVDSPETLLSMSQQVCDAMRYLESKMIIHRDLAARNCLVGRGLQVKVADFGLSRDVTEDEYTSSIGSKIPIKWCSIEVLHYKSFSSKSDVWAFGVLMWELFSGGTTPYAAHSNPEYISYIESGQRLQRPHRCDHEVYSMMMNMWNAKPEGRPTFSNLYERLCNLVDKYNELEQIQDF